MKTCLFASAEAHEIFVDVWQGWTDIITPSSCTTADSFCCSVVNPGKESTWTFSNLPNGVGDWTRFATESGIIIPSTWIIHRSVLVDILWLFYCIFFVSLPARQSVVNCDLFITGLFNEVPVRVHSTDACLDMTILILVWTSFWKQHIMLSVWNDDDWVLAFRKMEVVAGWNLWTEAGRFEENMWISSVWSLNGQICSGCDGGA